MAKCSAPQRSPGPAVSDPAPASSVPAPASGHLAPVASASFAAASFPPTPPAPAYVAPVPDHSALASAQALLQLSPHELNFHLQHKLPLKQLLILAPSLFSCVLVMFVVLRGDGGGDGGTAFASSIASMCQSFLFTVGV